MGGENKRGAEGRGVAPRVVRCVLLFNRKGLSWVFSGISKISNGDFCKY